MQDPSKAFDISSTSVLDLKAELFKQKEEFEKQKVIAKNQPVSAALRKAAKKPGIWERQNKGVLERSHRDELEIVETSTLEASRAAMERKAKLYDRLSKTGITDDALAEEVLVDFDRKAWEQPSDDEPTNVKDKSEDPWVEYVDEFGRTRVARKSQVPKIESPVIGPTIPGDDNESISDELLQRWEEAAKRELETGNGPIHYDETKEIRTKGVGFYRFSKDEEERQEQMRALKQLRLETELKRASRQTIKEKRKAQLDARMDMIRAKRQKKSSKSESKPTQTTENTITEPHISDVTNTSNISTTDSTINKTSNKVLQLSEQAVNDLLSDIRRQIEIKKKTDS
ncbi:hypothetical protein RclHR1_07140006 [Rhizophagus clarus]|uniref:Coiled-coil domain-containing protein 174 n=1 Tax=Rhizophagus clarus TaxID=94130 RepID=A0A2Z6SKP3_9GLOM|nr:hypothetical protein RclHR1_07140006 [Rhizophagus clarus]GES87144.1 coiled-coil domain-containing protein 174 [Rhizophagus clarus]